MKGTIVPFQKVTVRRRKKQMSTQKIQCIIQKKNKPTKNNKMYRINIFTALQ